MSETSAGRPQPKAIPLNIYVHCISPFSALNLPRHIPEGSEVKPAPKCQGMLSWRCPSGRNQDPQCILLILVALLFELLPGKTEVLPKLDLPAPPSSPPHRLRIEVTVLQPTKKPTKLLTWGDVQCLRCRPCVPSHSKHFIAN